jgi:hypothetical protein
MLVRKQGKIKALKATSSIDRPAETVTGLQWGFKVGVIAGDGGPGRTVEVPCVV